MDGGRAVLIDLLVSFIFVVLFSTFIGRVSLFWMEGGRRVRGGGGSFIYFALVFGLV